MSAHTAGPTAGPSTTTPSLHGLDTGALERWLAAQGVTGPFTLEQFAGGQSNPTYLVRSPSGEYVLRKQPPGDLLPSAHAIDREYRVLLALAGGPVPVPRPLYYCAERDVLGTPFYLMEHVPGRIFSDPALPGLTPAQRAAVYEAMNDALARLHTVDWRQVDLADFGRPDNFVARQLARWGRQFEAARTTDEPAMQRLRTWLDGHIPDDERAVITHGDYRIGNLVYVEGPPVRVGAVLDWELSTIGHPMSDLAFNCMAYHLPADDEVSPGLLGLDLPALGIPDEAAYLEYYARRSGIDPTRHWRFYMAFSLFRTAAIQHGVYMRFLNGSGASGERFGDSYRNVAEAGLRLID